MNTRSRYLTFANVLTLCAAGFGLAAAIQGASFRNLTAAFWFALSCGVLCVADGIAVEWFLARESAFGKNVLQSVAGIALFLGATLPLTVLGYWSAWLWWGVVFAFAFLQLIHFLYVRYDDTLIERAKWVQQWLHPLGTIAASIAGLTHMAILIFPWAAGWPIVIAVILSSALCVMRVERLREWFAPPQLP